MASPSERASSGTFVGPNTNKATTITMRSSGGPTSIAASFWCTNNRTCTCTYANVASNHRDDRRIGDADDCDRAEPHEVLRRQPNMIGRSEREGQDDAS